MGRRHTQLAIGTCEAEQDEDMPRGEVGAWLDQAPPSILRAPAAAVAQWSNPSATEAA